MHTLSVIAVTHFGRYSGVIEGEMIRKKKQGSVNIALPHTRRPNQAKQQRLSHLLFYFVIKVPPTAETCKSDDSQHFIYVDWNLVFGV